MDSNKQQSLCSWSFPYVQTCMILISHAFHCPGVQCYFIQDRKTWSKEDREKQDEVDLEEQEKLETEEMKLIIWGGTIPDGEKVSLPRDVYTLLMICHKSNHYAVMKIIPKDNIVQVWDAAADSK